MRKLINPLKHVVFLGFVLLLAFSATKLSAQTTFKYKYSYDDCGNRVKRVDTIIVVSKMINTETSSVEKSATESEVYVETLNDVEVSFYPNPNEGLLNLELRNLSSKSCCEVRLLSLEGRELIREEPGELLQLDFTGLSSGVYLLQIQINSEINTYKVVKK